MKVSAKEDYYAEIAFEPSVHTTAFYYDKKLAPGKSPYGKDPSD